MSTTPPEVYIEFDAPVTNHLGYFYAEGIGSVYVYFYVESGEVCASFYKFGCEVKISPKTLMDTFADQVIYQAFGGLNNAD